MKTPNKLILLCGAVVASLTCNLVAQTNPPAAPAGNGGKHEGHKLLQALNLTEEQKAKVAPILQKAKADAKAIRSDASLSKQQKHQQLQAVRQNTSQQLQAVLTPEQFQKLQQIRAERKGAHGAGGTPSTPAT